WILWLGVNFVFKGELTWGTFGQFALLAVVTASSVGALGEGWGDVQNAAGAMERVSELLAARPGIAAPSHPIVLASPPRGEVSLENTTFAYPGRPDLPAVKGLTL